MSCNYAEGLSPYENKGVLGLPEKFDTPEKLKEKCELLAHLLNTSKHVVIHTGAGISTSAGIPDFRGPNGVWTLEKAGKKPSVNVSFADAKPTKTHMILKKLVETNKVQYIVSQNIDGLHLKSGLKRKHLAELHGNMFIDECNVCKRQFVRSTPTETVGMKSSNKPCKSQGKRPCRGKLCDFVLDWEHSLPESDLIMAECHSSIADLSICLGTTLQIVPSGNLPVETVKYGGKLVICNLQPTKHDNKADLIINYYVDDILEQLMNILGLEIPSYSDKDNPILEADSSVIDWTIDRNNVTDIEKAFKSKCKGVKKARILIKNKRSSVESSIKDEDEKKPKLEKLTFKEERKAEICNTTNDSKDNEIILPDVKKEHVKNDNCEIINNKPEHTNETNCINNDKIKNEELINCEIGLNTEILSNTTDVIVNDNNKNNDNINNGSNESINANLNDIVNAEVIPVAS